MLILALKCNSRVCDRTFESNEEAEIGPGDHELWYARHLLDDLRCYAKSAGWKSTGDHDYCPLHCVADPEGP